MKIKLLAGLYMLGGIFSWFITYKLTGFSDDSFFEGYLGLSAIVFGSVGFISLFLSVCWDLSEEYKKRFKNDL